VGNFGLIDAYLRTLQVRLAWRNDSSEIDDEVRDHLYCAVEELEVSGIDAEAAQHQVLSRFGDPAAFAASFATSGSKGLALPTQFTRSVGGAAIIAASLWVATASAWFVSVLLEKDSGVWEGRAQMIWMLGAGLLLGATTLTVVVLVGLHSRHGGLGVVGYLGLALGGVGTVASLVGWFVHGWGALIGFGSLIVAGAMLKRGIAPRIPTVAFGCGWLLAGGANALLWKLEVGWRDNFGDYPLVIALSLTVGAGVFAAGLVGLGQWLRHEEPANVFANA
jgi:hypothetical protein